MGPEPGRTWASLGCLRRIAEPRGPSGHSLLTKARFAVSLTSSFLVTTVAGIAKDVYLEKFGCNGYVLWLLFTILCFVGPLFPVLVGVLQDKEYLGSCFPVPDWGRRAPWLLTHVILGAVAASLVFLPPGSYGVYGVSIHVTHAWYFVTVGVVFWSFNGAVLAFEAARQEIYPYKEERIVVEGLCKYACMLGGGLGGLPTMVVFMDARLNYRIACSAFILFASLISLVAVPVMRQARSGLRDSHSTKDSQVATGKPEEAGVSVWREAFRRGNWNWALRHMWALKFWNGAYGASIGSMLYYYITYVLRMHGAGRSAVILAAGAAAGCTETVMNVVYMWAFSRGDGRHDAAGRADRRLLSFVVAMRLLNAATTVLLLFVLAPSVGLFVLWAATCRVGVCSFTFWRVSAQCWLVDEDAGGAAERREGRILSSLSAVQTVAAAACGSVAFLGLSLCGLETRNCEADCTAAGAGDLQECMGGCMRDTIDGQPEALRAYIRAVIGLWAPLCELLLALHTHRFPIKGARLRRLYARVAERRGDGDGAAQLQGCWSAAPLDGLVHTTPLVDPPPGPKALPAALEVLDSRTTASPRSAGSSSAADQDASLGSEIAGMPQEALPGALVDTEPGV